jgi:hypothetical protein
MMRRHPRRAALIVLGVAVFIAISGLLARWLSLENVERSDIIGVLTAQVHGNAPRMLAQLHDCTPACRANVASDARQLKRRGQVLILADHSDTAYALTSTEGWTRIAWKVAGQLPVVECFRVERKGNALSGLAVTLLRVSRPIPTTSDC